MNLFYLLLISYNAYCMELELNQVINDIQLSSVNLSLNFVNLNINNGKLTFDRLTIDKQNQVDETTSIHYGIFENLVDPSVDPCDDFYAHVCNKWIEESEIDDDETSVGHMDVLSQLVQWQIQEVLDDNTTESKSREQQMAHDFYLNCVNHKTNPDNKAFDVMLEQLREARETDNQTLLTSWMIEFRPMNFVFDVSVGVNEVNSTQRIIQIAPVGSNLGYNSYTREEYQHEYVAMREFLSELVKLLQSDDSKGSVFQNSENKKRIDAFFKIDRILSNITQSNQYNRTATILTFDEVVTLLPSVNWRMYFRKILGGDVLDCTPIQLIDETALREIDELIGELQSDGDADLVYYLDWLAVMYFGEFFDSRYQNVMQTYTVATSGATTQRREKDCMSAASQVFYDVIAQIYIERFFSDKTRKQVTEMVNNIVQSFGEMLNVNEWMDEKTKSEALTKLRGIRKFVAYNDQIFNETAIEKKYGTLNFAANDNYYLMTLKIQQWTQFYLLNKLNATRTDDEFDFPPTDVNAFYDPTSNSIALTAAILQSPYFNISYPMPVNYGAIGAAIGHEITHGFDSSGADYDVNGNRANWWDEETMEQFTNRTKCFVDQYSNVTVEGTNMTIDGRLTLNENIADNGGIRASLRAVANEVARSGLMPRLAAFQQFFLSNAYVWCGKSRRQHLLNRLYTDVHSPEKWRINTVFSNQDEFAEAFACKPSSPMNPLRKCRVW